MAQIHANTEPIQFDDATADALKRALDAAANAVSGQAGSRQTAVNTASQEFRGRFSELFTQNASTAAGDGRTIVETLRTIAGWVDTMKEAAAAERARRKTAREWQAREDARSGIEEWWTEAWQLDPMPKAGNEPAPTFPAPNVTARPRETPDPGAGGGGGGGTSSARPADLRSFATACSGMNRDLDGKPAAVRGALQDFAARCSWGHIDAGNLVSAFEQWLAANDRDVQWANTVADAFAAAGGEGTVSTVADSALAAALQAAGVAATRSELQFDPPSAYGAQPTTGFSMDPVNTTTGNFLEPETDLDFPGSSPALRITRMYNSLDDHVGLFGPAGPRSSRPASSWTTTVPPSSGQTAGRSASPGRRTGGSAVSGRTGGSWPSRTGSSSATTPVDASSSPVRASGSASAADRGPRCVSNATRTDRSDGSSTSAVARSTSSTRRGASPWCGARTVDASSTGTTTADGWSPSSVPRAPVGTAGTTTTSSPP